MTSNTVVRLVQTAYENAKIVGLGQEPNSEQYVKGFNRLADLVATMQTEGMKIFTLNEYVLQAPTLALGVGTYSFGPTGTVVMTKPYRVEQAWFEDANGAKRPLIPLSWQEWSVLSQTSQQGSINQYLEDRQETLINIRLWQTPTADQLTGSVHILWRQQLITSANLTDDTQFPREWFLALSWMLADELCTGQNEVIQAKCAQKAAYYKDKLEGQDIEQAGVFFVPDSRGAYERDYR